MSVSRLALCASVSCALFASGPALAQNNAGLPTREQIELPEPEVAIPAAPEVRVERPAAAPCSFTESTLRVEITKLSFTDSQGNALPDEIARVLDGVEPAPGEQALAQMCTLRDEAAALLASGGYLAAVTIPPQELSGGQARLAVVLGRLVEVRVEGGGEDTRSALAGRIERLKSLYPLRTGEIERELLLASDVPGQQVAMSLAPAGTGPGELIGLVSVRRVPFVVNAAANNFGSHQVGRESGSVRVEVYGITGLDDVTFVGASATADFEEQLTIQAGHYFGFDSGLSFGGSFAYSWSRPDLGALDLRSESLLAAVEARAPLARTVRSRADLGLGLELIEQTSELGGGSAALPVTRDRLRVAYLRLSGRLREPSWNGGEEWSVSGTLELRHGLGILGASERGASDSGYFPSRFEGDPTAFLVRGALGSTLALTPRFAVSTQVQGQWSDHPLLAFEEFSIGNYTIGRGYDPGATSGDSALGSHIEPSWILPLRSELALQAYGFVDAVRIWNEDSLTTEDNRSLRSAGLGLRAIWPNRLVLDAGWAHPFDEELDVPGARRAPDRFLISLSTRFGPAAR